MNSHCTHCYSHRQQHTVGYHSFCAGTKIQHGIVGCKYRAHCCTWYQYHTNCHYRICTVRKEQSSIYRRTHSSQRTAGHQHRSTCDNSICCQHCHRRQQHTGHYGTTGCQCCGNNRRYCFRIVSTNRHCIRGHRL